MIDEPIQPPPTPPVKRETSPGTGSLIVLLMITIGFATAGFLGMTVASAFYEGTPGAGWEEVQQEFSRDMLDPVGKEYMKPLIWIAQGITTVFGLAVIPFFFWWSMRRKSLRSFFDKTKLRPIHFLLVIGIVISFLAFNSVVIEWNSKFDYPGNFDEWARPIEEKAMETVKFITSFKSVNEYLVAVLVMAVFGGFCEELAFRGLLQNEFQKAFKNHHIAIWVAAFFFSALHMQFYGFFPRMFLGALFGYLYYFSGNLWVPVFAHFLNNLFAVSSIYFGMEEVTGTEEDPTSLPWYGLVLSGVICAALIYYFRSIKPKPLSPDDVTA